MYDLEVYETFILTGLSPVKNPNEIEQAKEIVGQYNSSIDWLTFEASKQKDWDKKSQLQKEITAATLERDRLIKEINKVTT